MNNILVTGGCGFIGSHTALCLLEKGYVVYIIDSEVNSSFKVIDRLKKYFRKKGIDISKNLNFFKGDLRNIQDIERVFLNASKKGNDINGVIHFAGLKSVNESVREPLRYWDYNLLGTINLTRIMKKYFCNNFIFSSSATIYANLDNSLLNENCEIKPINPYGKTKATIESFLEDMHNSQPTKWKIINLRYFNPIGAHESGLIGESPVGMPNNIFPLILKVASKNLKELKIYGKNWNTRDGTCIRDYIHVMDLAEGHVSALNYLNKKEVIFDNFNIGTGVGTTVLELINVFEEVNNVNLPYSFASRRMGDQENVVADNSKIKSFLRWRAKKTIIDMCRDGWAWQASNPNGYFD